MDARKVSAFAVGPIIGVVLSFITLPVITWYFSAEDIGRIAMFQVLSSFVVLVFSLGLDQAYVREYHGSSNTPELLKATLLPGFVLLAMASGLCMLSPSFISMHLFSMDSISTSFLVILSLLAAFVSRFLSLILRMQEKGLAFSMSQALPRFIFLLLILSYIFLSFGFNFLYLFIAHAISIVSVALIFSWNTRDEWLAALSQELDVKKFKSMLSFGAPLVIGGAAFWGMTAMDKLFIRHFSNFEELGIYSVASSFAAAAIIFQSIFSTVWAPSVYKWAAEGINAEKIEQIREYVLAATIFLFVLAGLFSWLVTYLLPENYEKVQFILVACMGYPLFYTLSETTVIGLGITRKSGYAMLASIIAVMTSFAANYLLVPSYGAAGAAASTSFAFWIFLVLRTEFSCLVWRKIPRAKIYISTFFCLVAAMFTSITGNDYQLSSIVLWAVIGVVSLFLFRRPLKALRAGLIFRRN